MAVASAGAKDNFGHFCHLNSTPIVAFDWQAMTSY